MRTLATALLTISLLSGPAAGYAKSDKNRAPEGNAPGDSDELKDSRPDAVAPAAGSTSKPKTDTKAESLPENAVIENQLDELRTLVQEQRQELESQRAALKAQQMQMNALEEKLHSGAAASGDVSRAEKHADVPSALGTVSGLAAGLAGSSASSSSVSGNSASSGSASGTSSSNGAGSNTVAGSFSQMAPARAAMAAQKADTEKESPLYFKIGGAEFYPLGFMDLTSIYRTTQLGGIGTNFGSIAFGNTAAGRLSEERLSAQNSRIGLRTHAKFGEADVTGYLETDFLGFLPPNGNDTSNSNSLRLRLYWVNYKRGKFEVLGGQSWSFLTPNRNGLSALPADLFYSQDVDTNYQLGLTWARQAGIRFIVHPNHNWSVGLALENPEQTLPSSVVVPAAGVAGYASQFDSNSGNTSSATGVNNPNTPNLHPDVILKAAFDAQPGGHHLHFDAAGLFRTFKAVNVIATPSNITAANTVTSTIHGGGFAGTANIELVKNLRLIATGFYSYGGGRYIASTAGPDVIVRPNGTLSGIHAASGIGGFEYQPNPKTVVYGYYSGAYFGRNFDGAGTTPSPFTGYGFPGSPGSANRYLYEPTFGVHYMMWRNPAYGDLRLMTQYSYVSRTPWAVGPTALATAHTSMVYINLRYDLP